ncbi:4134_t:CDS:1, partial [Ambispora gerdemannii]
LESHIANIYKILNDENTRYKDAKEIAKEINKFIKDNNHDPDKIFNWFFSDDEQQHQNINPEYYFLIGFLCEWGIGTASSMKDSFYWYHLAAECIKDDPVVYNQVGYCYSKGFGVRQNHELAFLYFQKSAELRYAPGQKNLANCYANGLGTKTDLQKSLQLYQESAQAAYYQSALTLARYLSADTESQENQEKSFDWIRIAAYDSYPPAQTELGLYYLKSSNKVKEAATWFKLAAENGEPCGQVLYARFTRDSTEKFTYFKKAAGTGNMEGLVKLGDCYRMGIGTRINLFKAMRCFLKVAEKNGNDFDTYVTLAYHFSLGMGCPKDLHKTIRYYHKNPVNIMNHLERLF